MFVTMANNCQQERVAVLVGFIVHDQSLQLPHFLKKGIMTLNTSDFTSH